MKVKLGLDANLVAKEIRFGVSASGWSEGECKGVAGWFPSAYVEKRQRLPTEAY
ncbi:hypothetical protein Pint_10090 [Pistacia integerrima]|uniref:Uncharacterized protein n=1 Tax=Pistacia integerrima TaxID=434235 RepID=A0ACC0XFV5_9ROSI|nr:hypothetical protein Pint_10090 [Pistacia integerrima]